MPEFPLVLQRCFTAWAYWFARLMTAAEALAELRAQVPRQ
jgi:hypothetical protein